MILVNHLQGGAGELEEVCVIHRHTNGLTKFDRLGYQQLAILRPREDHIVHPAVASLLPCSEYLTAHKRSF
jgi:hypothetical protein